MSNIKRTYISLFSSAGVGCYGFKEAGFECIATNELLSKRLDIQRYNKKCKYESGYIGGNIEEEEIQKKLYNELTLWKEKEKIKDVDVIVATPPCQGMSVANHKKNNETQRNSLIVQSILIVKDILPRYFIFENVMRFLKTFCTDINGNEILIEHAIDTYLNNNYNIYKKVINFKDYGASSSRTRTLVIGVRKDIKEISPIDIFPKKNKERTLYEVIGHMKPLNNMGAICQDDIYHNFRSYDVRMLDWVSNTKEGTSAFENDYDIHKPHKIENGKLILNQNKNGDKYKRCSWSKVAPCVHTRNDIFSSQSTIHPKDNRVFSIRELMYMMNIPDTFSWVRQSEETLNNLSIEDKKLFLKKEELNIRHSIGEAVPTVVFNQIAENIIKHEEQPTKTQDISKIINKYSLDKNFETLYSFVRENLSSYSLNTLMKVVEFANSNRNELKAYYTSPNICYSLVKELPIIKKDTIKILEPSVGCGNFIPYIIDFFNDKKIEIDVIDIDNNSLKILRLLLSKLNIPNTVTINYTHGDFLTLKLTKKYDIVIGNPPYGKFQDKNKLPLYKEKVFNKDTSNIFSFFIEKAIEVGNNIAFITPKSLLSSPEYEKTRELIQRKTQLRTIIDYGEKAFHGVKIETISFCLSQNPSYTKHYDVLIESYITNDIKHLSSTDVFDKDLNYWLIYKNEFFKSIKKELFLSIYNFYRDRQITKTITSQNGKYRVLKSRNIENNEIKNIKGYDTYIDNIDNLSIKKYLKEGTILVPNLTYNPRACFKPDEVIVDGSVAILYPKNGFKVDKTDLEYYATEEFRKFYMIGRNLGTRSLNIDKNSIKLWGIKKDKHLLEHK